MSDDDDFMMEEDEEFDFEYDESGDDGADGEGDDADMGDVGLENKYYGAKGLKDEDPDEALKEFETVVAAQQDAPGDWGFKALKQSLKLSFSLGRLPESLGYYKTLLTYLPSAVSKNYAEKSINNLLDLVSSAQDMGFLEEFYSLTLAALEAAKNDRLSMKTRLKLAKVRLDRGEYAKLAKILKQLRESCITEDGADDQKKGTSLLEIYALEIQMHTETKNNKKLKEIYRQCVGVQSSAIPHPKIMGIIRECGGKMHMSMKSWDDAQTDFFEAFKNYDEAGSPQRINCLKYLVLANMLAESQIDPFDSQETKPYKTNTQITAMTDLVQAFQNQNIREFERILRTNQDAIMGDPFIKRHIDQVLKNIRAQVLVKLIQPYTRIEFTFVAQQLNITVAEVEELLVELILDQRVNGHLDQMNARLEMTVESPQDAHYPALVTLSDSVDHLFRSVIGRV